MKKPATYHVHRGRKGACRIPLGARLLVWAACLFPLGIAFDRLVPIELWDERVNVYVSDWILLLGVGGTVVWILMTKARLRPSGSAWWLVALLCVELMSTVVNRVGMIPALRMATQCAPFLLLASLKMPEAGAIRLLRSAMTWLLYVPLTVLLEAAMYALGQPIGAAWFGNFEGTTRFVGIAGDTAQASMISLLLSFVALYDLLAATSRRHAMIAGTTVLACVIANLLTGTRASAVCLVIGAGAILVGTGHGQRVVRGALTLAALAVTIGGASAFIAPLRAGIERFVAVDGDVLAVRVEPIQKAFVVANERPLTGWGFGSANVVLAEETDLLLTRGFVGSFNQYLQCYVEAGLPGLLVFVGFVAALARELRSRRDAVAWSAPGRALFTWLLILAFVYQTEVWFSPGSRISAVLLGLAGLLVGARPARATAHSRRSSIAPAPWPSRHDVEAGVVASV